MSVYLVAFVNFNDIDEYNREYREKTIPIIARHGGRAMIDSDASVMKEGAFPSGRLVVLRFPTMAAAEALYADPEYEELIEIRKGIANTQLGIFSSANQRE